MHIDHIESVIDDVRQGKMVVMIDDEERENEGDVIIAAEKVTAWHINFMAHHACGLICLPLLKERCELLRLPLMAAKNRSKFGTNFTVSIEAASGVTTGISAHDRAHTILVAVKKEARAEDVVQPGHVFPIMAEEGGVLVRPGHTEASIDMARLAGLYPAAVLCEILNEDGTMAKGQDLEKFAKKHGLKIGTIADLIHYRLEREKAYV
jgi:3,4-dihydroxy 2-butanone 4-phosphate synthase / GTP cyclohydrolase II